MAALLSRSSRNVVAEPFGGGEHAALAMGNPQRIEADLDDAEHAEDHRGVDVPHVSDPERLAGEGADAVAEHHAAFVAAVVFEVVRGSLTPDMNCRHRVGSLRRLQDIETECAFLRPDADRAADG